jgi:TolB protein
MEPINPYHRDFERSSLMRASILLAALLPISAPLAAQQGPIARARQVTASYTFDLTPGPDGKRAVMIRIVEGREQLFALDMDGGGEVQITHDAADHEDPVWSPDGRKIAFVRIADGKKIVTLINPDGSGAEPITPPSQSAIHPSFTPDGKAVLYCTDDDLRPPAKNESQIYAIDLATKRVKTLISGGVNTFPVMSPDGRKIAFRRIVGDMNSEVFVADADGTNQKNLTNHWSYEGWPAWSPDGKMIAYAGNRGNAGYQVFLMDADGGNVRLVAATEGRGTAPKWAPDGRALFFTVCRESQERRGCDIYMAPLDPPSRSPGGSGGSA